jgi:predicted permease
MDVYEPIIQIFIPIVLGYVLKTVNYIKSEISEPLRIFVIRVSVPLLIFSSLIHADFSTLNQFFPLVGAMILITTLMMGFSIALFYWMKDREKKTVLMWGLTFGNYAWIGWSVVFYALGQDGFNRALFFSTLFWPIFLSHGVFIAWINGIFKHTQLPIKNILINIFIPSGALLVAVIVNLTGIPIPKVLDESFSSIGHMTIPLVLFTVGLSISVKASVSHLKTVLPLAIVRPALGCVAGFLTLYLIGSSDTISQKVILLESTMPTAAMLVVVTDIFNLDRSLAASIVILSTLVAIPVIPLAIYFLI